MSDELAHFLIDRNRRALAIIAMLRDFAAQEDLLLLFSKRQRSE